MWSYVLTDHQTLTLLSKGCPLMTLYPKPNVTPWVQTQNFLSILYDFVSNNMHDAKDPDEMISLQDMVSQASANLIANYKANQSNEEH